MRLANALMVCLCLWPGLALAATRLGLHVTQEELTIWRQRMTDNVGTINGFTYQSIYQNRLLADANGFRGQSHPGGDGFWVGNDTGGCNPTGPGFGPFAGGTPYGRGAGAWIARAAFVFLLTGDTSYANPVRTELLNQITVPGTDFSNSSVWCGVSGQNSLEINPWIIRLILAYDYLLAGGYTGFSASEKTNIQTWFTNAANFWEAAHEQGTNSGGYQGIYNTPQDLTCSGSHCTDISAQLYYNGPQARSATYNWMFNQANLPPLLSVTVGTLTNNTILINKGKAWITAFVKVGIWDNGAISDTARWNDCGDPGCPGSAWGHMGGLHGGVTLAMDILARTGDISLYALSGPTQVLGGGGGTVSWLTHLKLMANMANNTVQLYATTLAGSVGEATRIRWNPPGGELGFYTDFSSMAANLYYQDSDITTAMTRASAGSNTNGTSGCYDNQTGGCVSGVHGFWPDLPFMYGHMEGVVNPYSLTASGPPTATITAPTSSPTFSTSTTPLTTLAGTATDDVGVTSVTWSCPTCTPTSGTATCTTCGVSATAPSWSVASIGLASGSNVITVTANDADVQTGTDTLTVTYPAGPGTATILRLGP